MSRMNTGRVIVGGLAAGVAANALDFVINRYLLFDQMNEMVVRLNLRADLVERSIWTWLAFDMIYGLLVVFTYAAIRPRFGPGPATAMIAGGCYWLAFTAMSAGYTAMGMFSDLAFIKSAAFTLVSTLVPAQVGGAIYQEPEEPVRSATG
jgi:hypothetical protein